MSYETTTPEEAYNSKKNFFWLRKMLTSVKKMEDLPTLKLVVIGNGAVGKSALTIQFFQKAFMAAYDPTIEDTYVKHAIVDNYLFVMDVIDTAGQEEYSAMREQYMRSGDGFLIVYSVDDLKSYNNVRNFYEQVLRVQDVDSFPVVLVANKVDLSDRKVTEEMGKELAQSLGITEYVETSAKDPTINVAFAFHQLVRVIRSSKAKAANPDTDSEPQLQIQPQPQPKLNPEPAPEPQKIQQPSRFRRFINACCCGFC